MARLVLETIPDGVEVFVDGFYEGLAEDFGLRGRPLIIATGAHRIELRAAGYETPMFSVVIDPDEILRYRGNMQLVSTRPAFIVVPALGAAAKPSVRHSEVLRRRQAAHGRVASRLRSERSSRRYK